MSSMYPPMFERARLTKVFYHLIYFITIETLLSNHL